MSSKLVVSALFVASLVLSGCAATNENTQTQVETPQAPVAVSPVTAPEPVAETPPVQQLEINPVIAFAEDSTELDDAAQAQIGTLLASARRANKIVIYGYSDRNNGGDAKQIAISRALRVRTELLKNGVSADNIRIRYSTEDARHEAKVVIDEQKLTVVDNSPATMK